MYDRTICTGDEKEINDALESFPSGHSTAACRFSRYYAPFEQDINPNLVAGFIFLSLYLNGKLKVFSNYAPHCWKLTAVYAPVLGATLIAGSLTIDEFHNWYDVVAGGTIGTMFALSAYRMMYASVWDFRFNHVPLPRGNTTLGYGYGLGGTDGWEDAVATRKAGWGSGDGMYGGAPSDAANMGGAGAISGGHRGHRARDDGLV